jgi:hypothetical protein
VDIRNDKARAIGVAKARHPVLSAPLIFTHTHTQTSSRSFTVSRVMTSEFSDDDLCLSRSTGGDKHGDEHSPHEHGMCNRVAQRADLVSHCFSPQPDVWS